MKQALLIGIVALYCGHASASCTTNRWVVTVNEFDLLRVWEQIDNSTFRKRALGTIHILLTARTRDREQVQNKLKQVRNLNGVESIACDTLGGPAARISGSN